MKQISIIVIFLILAIACNNPVNYTINGVINGKDDKIEMVAPGYNRLLQSVNSANGKFTFKGNVDTAEIIIIQSINSSQYKFMILEPGNFSIDLSDNSRNNFDENSYNGKLYKLFALRDSLYEIEKTKISEIEENQPENESKYSMDSLYLSHGKLVDKKAIEIFTENENNALGIMSFLMVKDSIKFDSLYNELGDFAKSHGFTKQFILSKK